jgi:hypothetical protein
MPLYSAKRGAADFLISSNVSHGLNDCDINRLTYRIQTTLLTPYPTTTITNYETNIYPTYQVLTTSSLVTENPVALYTNPAYAIPQNTEILSGSTETATGGVTM